MDVSASEGPITESSVVVASDHQVSAELGDDRLVVDVATGRYFRLPEVGARIWGLLVEPVRVSTILDTIVEQYEVDRARCEHDLIGFLSELRDRGLIRVETAVGT